MSSPPPAQKKKEVPDRPHKVTGGADSRSNPGNKHIKNLFAAAPAPEPPVGAMKNLNIGKKMAQGGKVKLPRPVTPPMPSASLYPYRHYSQGTLISKAAENVEKAKQHWPPSMVGIEAPGGQMFIGTQESPQVSSAVRQYNTHKNYSFFK